MKNAELDSVDKALVDTYVQQGLTRREAAEFVRLMDIPDLSKEEQARYNTLATIMSGSREKFNWLLDERRAA